MSAPFGGHSRIVQAGLCTVLILLVGAAACAQTGAGQDDANPINMNLRDVSLQELLPLLVDAAGINVILGDPDVDVHVPGLSLRDTSREEIIQILKALVEAQGYHWAEVGRFYMVTKAPPSSAQAGSAPQTAPASVDREPPPLPAPELVAPLPTTMAPPTAPTDTISAEIVLNNINAQDVARMFGGTALYSDPPPAQVSRTSRGAYRSAGAGAQGSWPGSRQQGGMGPMGIAPNQFGDFDQDYGGGGFGGGGGGFGGGGFGGGGFGGGFGMVELLPGEMLPPLAYMPLNKLLVQGTQAELDAFREIVALLDVAPRQVEISTQFIEVSANIFEAFGSTWSVMAGNWELFPIGTGLVGNLVGRFRAENFEASLSVAMQRAKGRIVNAPRVVTLNNQFAEFSVSTDIPFFIPQTQVTQGVVNTTYDINIVSVANGLFVTPRINADDTISMYLQPQLADQVGVAVAPDGQEVPITSQQTASALVRVPDGETAVIGGLVRRTDSESTVGTPFLSELPIIGRLFQRKSINKDDRELLIFVTPRIIRERGGGLEAL